MKTKDILFLIILGAAFGACMTLWGMRYKEAQEELEKEVATVKWRSNHFKLNESNLMDELNAQGVAFPEIVKAQAVLETGHFKSYSCLQRNNLFGLRRKDGTYMSFDHWTESVAAYKTYIQKWNQPPSNYYHYLDSMGYAEDKSYTNKLKQMLSKQH